MLWFLIRFKDIKLKIGTPTGADFFYVIERVK